MGELSNDQIAAGREDICRRGYRGRRRLRSLGEIVYDYKCRFKSRAASELRFFARMRTLGEAVTQAGLARMPNGKRWSHQRRIPGHILDEATQRLRRANLAAAGSFDELLKLIEQAVDPLRGIGELYIYDTALRIGARVGKLPQRVYLHAGARAGAVALGFDPKERSIDPKKLPAPFHTLRPHELEDVLCIYKEWLACARNG